LRSFGYPESFAIGLLYHSRNDMPAENASVTKEGSGKDVLEQEWQQLKQALPVRTKEFRHRNGQLPPFSPWIKTSRKAAE
jgi:hypothetical protein